MRNLDPVQISLIRGH